MVEFSSSLFIGHSTIHMLSSSICRLAAALLLPCCWCAMLSSSICRLAAALLLPCCWRAAVMLLAGCSYALAMLVGLLCRCHAAVGLLFWCGVACSLPLAVAVLLSLRSVLFFYWFYSFIGFGLLHSTMPFRFELFNCSSPFFLTIQRELLDQSIFLCVADTEN